MHSETFRNSKQMFCVYKLKRKAVLSPMPMLEFLPASALEYSKSFPQLFCIWMMTPPNFN